MPDPGAGKFKIGDRVSLKTQTGRIGKVVGYRGRFGTKGDRIYRVLVGLKPRPSYIEVLESQMDQAPAESGT
jgi:hypothetical protein